MSVPASILACYRKADSIAKEQRPYALGGGHDWEHLWQPSKDIRAAYAHNVGWDCSGSTSAVLHDGHILDHPSGPLSSQELEHWGEPGKGRWMTVWVINDATIQHVFIEFDIPGRHKFFAARHTGTIVGWWASLSTAGFHPRRRAA